MKVQLQCADDIWLQANIPDKVSIDSFLEKVAQIEQVIARDKKPSREPLPPLQTKPKTENVDDRLNHLEQSTQKIISLLDNLQH